MANISKFLEKIKSAVYGKDMRQSLHDAIKNTNDDLNTFKDTKAQANGLASLGADGKIPDEQMPDLSIVDTFVVPNQATMLALMAQKGDFAVRTDINQLFVLKRSPASNLDNWHNFGIIVLNKSSIGLGNVDNTSDIDKPISTAQREALQGLSDRINDVNDATTGLDREIGDIKSDLQTAQDDIDTLNGADTVNGSVDKKIKDAITAFAQAITDNNTIDTFQEVLSWISTHGSDFAALVRDVNQNAVDIANLKNGFTYNSDDSEWNFTGDVLNFGDGNGELYLNDGYAVRLNSSDFSGYSTLSAMAEDLTDVKEFVDLWAYDSTNNKYIFDIGTNDLQIGHQGSAPDMYVYYGIQCGSDVNLGRNALDLDSSVYSGYSGLSEMAEDLADLKRNGISNTLSTVEKSQLIAEIKQAVIADINNNIDGGGFDEESSEQ